MSLIPLNPERFAGARWQPMPDSAFAREVSLVELNASELPAAACHLPVGFVRNADGQLGLHAVLGVQPGKNLFVAADGSWLGGHWPLRLRLAPFALALSETGENVLCVNDAWWQPLESGGFAFYAEGGDLGPETATVLQECQALLANQQQTHAALAALDEAGLIRPWNPVIVTAAGNVQLEGLFAVDEAALNALEGAALQHLRDAGALAIAYCQLLSMQHARKLGELANAHARLDAAKAPSAVVGLAPGLLSDDGLLNLSNLGNLGNLGDS